MRIPSVDIPSGKRKVSVKRYGVARGILLTSQGRFLFFSSFWRGPG